MTNHPTTTAPHGAGWRAGVAAMTALLGPLDQHVSSDRERIDAIDALRGLIAAAGAAQVRLTAAYAASQKALGASARGVAAEVGFAQRVGIAQAQRLVAAACTLTADLPETLELVSEGELSVERARVVAERVADVEPQVRHVVDDRISGEVDLLADRQVRDAVDAIVMQVDADHVEQRRLAAFQRRRVSVRPIGDGMAWFSILTSLVDAHLAEQALRQHADRTLAEAAQGAEAAEAAQTTEAGEETRVAQAAGSSGAETSLSQGAIMADAAIDRLTGRVEGVGPQVAVHLIMTPDTLTGTGPGRDLPAHVLGVGPMPARAARDLLKVGSSPTHAVRAAPVVTSPDASDCAGSSPSSDMASAPTPAAHAGTAVSVTCSGSDLGTATDSAMRSGSNAGSDADSVARLSLDDGAWQFFDVTPEQRRVEGEQVRRQVRRDTREESRVTVRRLFVDVDGRTVTGMDARAGVMPAAFRARLAHPDSDRDADGDADGAMTAWLSLLRSPPEPERLVPLESMARLFIGLLRQFMLIRDKTCRAPWCGALIRHIDHAHPWAHGGATSAINGNGDCAGHNLAKESPGYRVTTTVTWDPHDGWNPEPDWAPDLGLVTDPPSQAGLGSVTPGSDPDPDPQTPAARACDSHTQTALVGVPARPHTVTWQTPTGRTWTSSAPPPLGWGAEVITSTVAEEGAPRDADSPLERRLAALLGT